MVEAGVKNAKKITLQGDRYSEHLKKMVGR
jgi:hypothetical protein